MKAICVNQFGEADVLQLQDVNRPEVVTHQVLIKVKAIGVNYADVNRRKNQYVVPTPLPFIPGSEVSGEIVELGSDVQEFQVGDRVTALLGPKCSGYAEYALGHPRTMVRIPVEIDDIQAAVFPLQGLTAYHILKTSARLQKGETVLIHAAAGGVGTLAVQLAKRFGAGTVIATAGTPEKRALAQSLGADYTIDYTVEDWPDEVLRVTHGEGVDVVLESIGGNIFEKNLLFLKKFGRIVVFGAASGQIATLNPRLLIEKCQSVVGFLLSRIVEQPKLYRESMQELIDLIVRKDLKLMIGGTFPLEDAARVHRLLESRKTIGKLILQP